MRYPVTQDQRKRCMFQVYVIQLGLTFLSFKKAAGAIPLSSNPGPMRMLGDKKEQLDWGPIASFLIAYPVSGPRYPLSRIQVWLGAYPGIPDQSGAAAVTANWVPEGGRRLVRYNGRISNRMRVVLISEILQLQIFITSKLIKYVDSCPSLSSSRARM